MRSTVPVSAVAFYGQARGREGEVNHPAADGVLCHRCQADSKEGVVHSLLYAAGARPRLLTEDASAPARAGAEARDERRLDHTYLAAHLARHGNLFFVERVVDAAFRLRLVHFGALYRTMSDDGVPGWTLKGFTAVGARLVNPRLRRWVLVDGIRTGTRAILARRIFALVLELFAAVNAYPDRVLSTRLDSVGFVGAFEGAVFLCGRAWLKCLFAHLTVARFQNSTAAHAVISKDVPVGLCHFVV